jgi:replicative DNA helicase
MLARVCLEKISPSRANSGDDWRAVGYACKGTSEQLKDDWVKWSSTWPEFDLEECEDRWRRFDSKSSVGTLVHMASVDSGCSSVAIIEEATQRLKPVSVDQSNQPKRTPTLTDAIDEWSRLEELPCIPTSLPSINELFGGGIPVGQMTALAAAPGIGKSALAMHLALDCLNSNKEMVAMWCLGEMTKSAIAARAIANYGGMDNRLSLRDVIDKRDPSRKVGASLAMSIGDRLKLVESPLHLEKIEEAIDRDRPKLLVVDYLQLVRSSRNYTDKTAEINECLLSLREITTTRNIATLLVTNIAKGVTEATEIGNIGKGSNQIDFDVDNLIFGHRVDKADAAGCQKINWACKKLRQGQMRDVQLWFHGPYQWFEDTREIPQPCEALSNADWSPF